MSITQGMCTSFKAEILQAIHDITDGGDTIKLALYDSTADLGVTTTAYTTTGEISDGTYVAGGNTLTVIDPTTSGTVAFADFEDSVWSSTTLTARGGLIYNSSKADRAICVLDFGSDRTNTGADFTVTFPAGDAENAIIRIGP